MTHLDRFADWVSAHRAEMERAGTVKFTRGGEDVPNPSAILVVELAGAEVELLLWTTGEAEFNHGPLGQPVFEHVDIEAPEELDSLLRRVLAAVVGE